MQVSNVKNDPTDPSPHPKRQPVGGADMVLAILLGVIVTVMFAQVFFRYVLNNSLSWSEEIVRFLFIWLTFLGAALNIRDRWHIGVDFFVNLLPKRWRRGIFLFDSIVLLLFLLFLSIGGWVWVYYAKGASSSALGLPLHLILYGALPVTSLLGCYYAIRNIRNDRREQKREKDA